MKVLYFDIDGTVLQEDTATAKPALANGRFEQMVLTGGFDRIVCVGHMATVIQHLASIDPDTDQAGIVFRYCDGAFGDLARFRTRVEFTEDSAHRARYIEYGADWWYVDDLAAYYLGLESLGDVLGAELGRRVFVPRPNGDGSGTAAWLERALE